MQLPASIRGLLATFALATLIALPSAAAFSIGTDAPHAKDLNAAGGHAAYGQTWVGLWSKSSWSAYESDLRDAAAAGSMPVVMWYYWGDSISQSCVNYGCDGRSKGDWDAMATTLAQKANSVLSGKPFLLVLEPEFNKQGIAGWETFDGYLVNQINLIKRAAPAAKIVLGFGSWGGYDAFDRAASASDYTGFQFMRASTRNSVAESQAPADSFIATAKDLKARFGKPVFVFDLAIGSYGGWEWVQQAALQNLKSRAADLTNAGIVGVVWRYVYDNDYSSGYFGAAESTWGLKTSWGGAKSGWDDLVAFSKGATPTSTSGGTTPTSTSSAPSGSFSGVSGNNWWIQASIGGAPSGVFARVNGGSWIAMPKQSWGGYAVSTYAPTGSVVELRADFPGASSVTGAYSWPAATPVTSSSGFTATFSNVHGNAWWIQADVSGSQAIASVAASINGGAWQPLAKQSWGSWAASLPAPAGSSVRLRATSTTGATATSGTYVWG